MKKLVLMLGVLLAGAARAEEYPLPPPGVNVVGKVQIITAKKGDTFADIGREYGIGYDALANANKGLDGLYLKEGDQVILPTRFILPDAPRTGIVINLPEMRLYYYPPDKPVVDVYAIGIGREGWGTPEGIMRITEKKANPTWTPPASVRKEHAEAGDPLPAIVPAGPDNPLGLFAMRLSNPSYLIHGTNKPDGVGMRVSHGCIRMYPEGIESLFHKVSTNTQVNILNQPMKIGWYGDDLFLEFHSPLGEYALPLEQNIANARSVVEGATLARNVAVAEADIDGVVTEETGLPTRVGFFGRE